MANVQLTLTPDQATALLEILERAAEQAAQNPQHQVSEREAQRMLVIWSLRDAMRTAGVRPRSTPVGCCDDRDEK